MKDQKESSGPFEFSEVFTVAVRRVLPQILSKRLSHSFDVRGPEVFVASDADAVGAGLHRLLLGALDLIDVGFLVLDAETCVTRSGKLYICVKAGGTGRVASQQRIGEVLERLQMTEAVDSSDQYRPLLRRATGVCPATGAALEFASSPSQGVLFSAKWVEPHSQLRMLAPPDLRHARAWVINEDSLVCESLVRRLQRLGWATTKFGSYTQAIRQLRAMQADHARPALVVGVESHSFGPAAAQQLRALLPAWTHCVYALASGSGTLLEESAVGDWDLAVRPLSPLQLHRLSCSAWQAADMPSGETTPAPLSMSHRPLMVIVDDEEVNRVVASGLAQTLGYEVAAADGGEQAVELCRRLRPSVVLMDLRMHPLDGFETTRRLRALEQSGEIPPCRIVAQTSDDHSEVRLNCVLAGMDGFVAKPLMVHSLRAELRRVCAGCSCDTPSAEDLAA
jgi:CheY-like chemotaxis protein